MSKTVTFVADVYPYCVNDVVTLDDAELARVDKEAKARKLKAYEFVTYGTPSEDAKSDKKDVKSDKKDVKSDK